MATNDNWGDSANKQEIMGRTVAPTNDKEAAIPVTLSPAAYTATVRGVNGTTSVALVEIYDLAMNVDSRASSRLGSVRPWSLITVTVRAARRG